MEGKKGKLGRRDLLAGVAALGAVGPHKAEAARTAPDKHLDHGIKSATEGLHLDKAVEHLFRQRPDIFQFDPKTGRLKVRDSIQNRVVYNRAFETATDTSMVLRLSDDGSLMVRTTLRSKVIRIATIRVNKQGGVAIEFQEINPPSFDQ